MGMGMGMAMAMAMGTSSCPCGTFSCRSRVHAGIPDSNIIVMLGDEMACSPRNPYPATIWNDAEHSLNLYDSTVEVRKTCSSLHALQRSGLGQHREQGLPSSPRVGGLPWKRGISRKLSPPADG